MEKAARPLPDKHGDSSPAGDLAFSLFLPPHHPRVAMISALSPRWLFFLGDDAFSLFQLSLAKTIVRRFSFAWRVWANGDPENRLNTYVSIFAIQYCLEQH